MYSLNDLNTRKASESPYTFEFVFCGKPSGILLSVIGQQSETFEAKAMQLAKDASLAQELNGDAAGFVASARNKELTQRLVAARLVEWAGIAEPLTDETAFQFVANTDGALDQILAASNKIGNFIKL